MARARPRRAFFGEDFDRGVCQGDTRTIYSLPERTLKTEKIAELVAVAEGQRPPARACAF